MKQKLNILKNILISTLVLISISSCESHEKAADDTASQLMYGMDETTGEAATTSSVMKPAPKQINLKNVQPTDDWTNFKTETKARLTANETYLTALKANTKMNTKLLTEIARLERSNAYFTKEIADFDLEEKERKEKFKNTLTISMEEMNQTFNELKLKNK